MTNIKFYKALNEANLSVPTSIRFLDESTQMKITDEVMGEMFKFISEKYTSLDFSEIEKSNGNIKKFKYIQLLKDNIQILRNIYDTDEESSKNIIKYVGEMEIVLRYLENNADDISYLYEKRIGVIQMFYVSTVAALVYGMSALISMTVRFVNNEDTSEILVVFDEIPSPQKYVHLRNIDNAYSMISDNTINSIIIEYMKNEKRKINESVVVPVVLAAPAIAALALPVVIYLSTKIIPFIREAIYSIFYSRVKWEMAIDLQINLLKTNIESLEQGRGSKKIIANQKNVVKALEKAKDIIMIKNDKAESQTKKQIEQENRELKVPTKPTYDDNNDLLI